MLFFRSYKLISNVLTVNKLQQTLNSLFSGNIKSFKKTNLKHSFKKFNPMDKFVVLPSPIKSASDKKDYRVIKLKNGLTACLISDTKNIIDISSTCTNCLESEDESTESGSEESNNDTESDENSESENEGDHRPKHKVTEQKMAAAALCVGVGSFSDPREVPGMAHFLEHMVFMGSEKFPEENDFDSYLKKSGGSNNASTDTETTCFYFECLEEHMFTALDKFAQFFIAPLMNKGAMTREREAIESEFQMALPSDSSKREQLLFTFAKPNSPVNSFSWGNLITLKDNISDDQLYNGVHKFRKRHYSAHRMTLAIQARLSLDTLQDYVLKCFENVPNNNLPPNDFSQFKGSVFDTPEFCKMYYVKPSKDICRVDLTWSLYPLFDQYKCNPMRYVSHLLGDEGTGSIAAYLRRKLWAITVNSGNSGSGDECNSIYTLFTISIYLTDKGVEHLSEVLETVFSYINLLKRLGPQEDIYNELKSIDDVGFKFAIEETAQEMVEDLCENMLYFPPEDYLTADNYLHEYDSQVISTLTNSLVPDKVNIMVMTSKDLPKGVHYNEKEKWFGTKYVGLDIPPDWIKTWTEIEPYPQLALPKPNPYLTEDFSILPKTDAHPEYPEKILSNPKLEVWYRQDQKFKLPLGFYYFYLISPLPMESAKNSVLLDMMMNILTFVLAEKLYPASSADLDYNCLVYEKGLCLKVYGYNEKLPLIIDVIAQYLLNLNHHFDEDQFKAIKETLLKSYYNKLLKPSSLAKDIRLQLLVDKFWPPADKFAALQNTTFEEIVNFTKEYMEKLYLKILVQGNVSQQTVTETVNKLVKHLNYSPLPSEEYPKYRVIQVPKGEKCIRVDGFNKRDTNSIVTNYYQCSQFSLYDSVMIDIIMLIIEEPLFDILRTKEQLGYHVYCSSRDTFGVLGYTITVNAQATKFSTDFIDSRIEEFLKHTKKLLSNTSEKDLEKIKQDLIKTKECVDVYLKEEVSRNWSEIINDEYIFDRLLREIDAIKKINVKQVREWWSSHNRFGNKNNFRKISFQVVGHDIKDYSGTDKEEDSISEIISTTLLGNEQLSEKEKKDKDYFIPSIELFKQQNVLYPPIQINKKE